MLHDATRTVGQVELVVRMDGSSLAYSTDSGSRTNNYHSLLSFLM